MQDKLQFAPLVGRGEHKKEDAQVPLPTMQFGEFGENLVHQTTAIDVVGYKVNRTRKRVRSFPLKIWQSSRETGVP